jgi:biopolymer transport protein ExbB
LVVWLLLDLRGSAAIPTGFVDDFTDTVNKRKFKEAFDMAKEDNSYLGRVLTAGMGRLQYGLEDAREAAANTLDAIKGSKDRWNNYIAVIGTLGPLLGLVGTVYGMIQAFIALSDTSSKEGLTEGISHALCVTLIGVMIAVPAIALNTFFRNRITQVTMDVGHVADDLLTQMYHNSKKAGPSPSTPAMPTQPPPPR